MHSSMLKPSIPPPSPWACIVPPPLQTNPRYGDQIQRNPSLKTLKYVHSCRYISPSPPLVNSSYTRDYFRVNSPLRCKETKIEVERGSPRSPPSVKFWEGLMLEWRPNLEPAWCPLPSKQTLKIETKFRDPPSNMLIHVDISPSPPLNSNHTRSVREGGGH